MFNIEHLNPYWLLIDIRDLAQFVVEMAYALQLEGLKELEDSNDPFHIYITTCSILDNYYKSSWGDFYSIDNAPQWRLLNCPATVFAIELLKPPWNLKRWPSYINFKHERNMLTQSDILDIVNPYLRVSPGCIMLPYTQADAHITDAKGTGMRFSTTIETFTPDYIERLNVAGIKRIGILLSTGKAHELPDGGHWMCCVCDISDDDYHVAVFDSLAKDIRRLPVVDEIIQRMIDCNPSKATSITVKENHLRIQKSQSPVSCGLYVAHFLVRCLCDGVPFEEVLEDETMRDGDIDEVLRPFYFPISTRK